MNKVDDTWIYCPCTKCYGRYFIKENVAKEHLVVDGFLPTYRIWTKHRESTISRHTTHSNTTSHDSIINDYMVGILHDAMGTPHMDLSYNENHPMKTNYGEMPNPETSKFLKLIQEVESPLY